MADDELKFLRHLEMRSELDGMTYGKLMPLVTDWKNPVFRGKTVREISKTAVYKIAEDLGLRAGVRAGQFADPDELNDHDLVDLVKAMKPVGILGHVRKVQMMQKVRAERRRENRDKRRSEKSGSETE
ncbi:MAG TPA: hypothetical protein PLV45_13260 [bacterium]|nr:hypothetical protein [bacterium]